MAELPRLHTLTALAIEDACRKLRTEEAKDAPNLRMSSIGNPCDRALWYALRWAHPPAIPEPRISRIFDNGHDREERLVSYLRTAGFTVTNAQAELAASGGVLIGHIDGVIEGIPEEPKTPHLLEIKTMNAARFKAFRSKGLVASNPKYWTQANAYAVSLGLDRILFVVECQDTKAIHTERLQADPVAAAQVFARAERIARAVEPPERMTNDANFWECRTCPAYQVCHKGAPARRNCRTCAAFGLAGRTCLQDEPTKVPPDVERIGCGYHLYIPGLVDGEQIDADEKAMTVTYRRPDGSIWIDKGPGS
jgi:hypothetical protein